MCCRVRTSLPLPAVGPNGYMRLVPCRCGKVAPAPELLEAAEAAGVGPAALSALAQAWPQATAWQADPFGFVENFINRLAKSVGRKPCACAMLS